MRTRLMIPAAVLVAVAYIKGRQDAHGPGRTAHRAACDLPDDVRRRAEAEAADARELFDERAFARRAAAPAARDLATAASETAAVIAPPPPAPAPAPPPAHGWEAPEFPVPPRPRRPEPSPAPASPPRPPAATPPGPDDPDLARLGEWEAPPAGAAPASARTDEVPPLVEWSVHVAPPVGPAPAPVEVRIDESGRFTLGGWAAQAGHIAVCGVTFRDRHDRPVAASDIRLVPEALANVEAQGVVVLGDPGFAPDAEGFTLLVAAAGPGAFAASGRYELLSMATAGAQ